MKMLLVILALLFFSLVIWFGGPFVQIDEYTPLGSELARIIGIVLLLVLWGLRAVWRRQDHGHRQLRPEFSAGAEVRQGSTARRRRYPQLRLVVHRSGDPARHGR